MICCASQCWCDAGQAWLPLVQGANSADITIRHVCSWYDSCFAGRWSASCSTASHQHKLFQGQTKSAPAMESSTVPWLHARPTTSVLEVAPVLMRTPIRAPATAAQQWQWRAPPSTQTCSAAPIGQPDNACWRPWPDSMSSLTAAPGCNCKDGKHHHKVPHTRDARSCAMAAAPVQAKVTSSCR